MANNQTRIIIAGFGGQGVVLAGNILARAAVIEDKNVTGMVSYGAEMRGGTANSTIVISDEKIASPFVEIPDVAIIMNQPSRDKFEPDIVSGGLAVINSTMVEDVGPRTDIDRVSIDASDIAISLGNARVANVVILGAFVKKTGILKQQSVITAIDELFSSKKPAFVEINTNAFNAGYEA
jgi:2-oxoglutarate ferredoxin oxidoreductase subunit gamma